MATASSSLAIESSGRIVQSVSVNTISYESTSDHSTVPSVSANTEYKSNQLLDITNYSTLSITGYFVVYRGNDVYNDCGNASIKLYNEKMNSVLMTANLNRGTLNTVNLNVASIKEKVYLVIYNENYAWGWAANGRCYTYIERISIS